MDAPSVRNKSETMNDSIPPNDESSPQTQPPCSRAEAIGTGIWAILFAHLVVCLLAVAMLLQRFVFIPKEESPS